MGRLTIKPKRGTLCEVGRWRGTVTLKVCFQQKQALRERISGQCLPGDKVINCQCPGKGNDSPPECRQGMGRELAKEGAGEGEGRGCDSLGCGKVGKGAQPTGTGWVGDPTGRSSQESGSGWEEL